MKICDDLRQAVIRAAIQGKLTTQRPEDGDARELLKQIAAEKAKLIKEKKIKKEKPLPEITEEEIPFDVPENWVWCRLNYLVYNSGQMKPDSDFCYIDIGSIDNKKQILSKEENIICAQDAPSRARKIVKFGDIIYSTVRPYLHNMAIIDKEFPLQPIASTGFAVLSCCKGVFNKFLFYYLLSPYFDEYANNIENAKGVAYPAINDEKFYKAVIPLPPLAEQHRIVAKVEKLKAEIDELEKVENELHALKTDFPGDMKAALLQAAMQGKLTTQRKEDGDARDLLKQIAKEKAQLIKEKKIKKEKPLPEITEDEIPFDVPENWVWVRISNATFFQEGPGILAKDFRTEGVPLIRIAGMQTHNVSLEGCNYLDPSMVGKKWEHFRLDLGDIIISTSASLDKIAEVGNEAVGAIPYTGLIRFKMLGGIDKSYFKMFIMSPCYINQIANQEAGGTIKHYGPSHLRKMFIPLPPLAEQHRIVAKLEKLLPLCDGLVEE